MTEEGLQDTEHILNEDRHQIDLLDQEILNLLNERAKLSVNIAMLKSRNKMPVFVPERENSLLEQIISMNKGPLTMEAIRNIFLTIMDESKKLQSDILNQNTDRKSNDIKE